jgi:hypothetical protein
MIALLDSHPDLSVIPLEVKFYDHYYSALGANGDYEALDKFFFSESKLCAIQETGVTTMDPFNSGYLDFSNVDFDTIRRHMETQALDERGVSESKRSLIAKYMVDIHHAYSKAIGRPFPKGFVVKEGNHGLPYLGAIKQDFPNAKIIVMVRDPRAIFSSSKAITQSTRASYYRAPADPFSVFINLFRDNGRGCYSYMKYFQNVQSDDGFHFVRYEDLVQNTRPVMRDVGDFLGVDFCESMLAPTVAGNPWGGNSSDASQLNSVDSSKKSSWKQLLDKKEISLIEYSLADYMKKWRYVETNPKSSLWRCMLSLRPVDLFLDPVSWRDFVRPFYRIGHNILSFASNIYRMVRGSRRHSK